jgi:hypothetical protein
LNKFIFLNENKDDEEILIGYVEQNKQLNDIISKLKTVMFVNKISFDNMKIQNIIESGVNSVRKI